MANGYKATCIVIHVGDETLVCYVDVGIQHYVRIFDVSMMFMYLFVNEHFAFLRPLISLRLGL